ncbi:hypothetical protein OPT61_g1164 [Boeremia exigua]|uniref:Uncharacterized protein n=1 Tax=Boeremia exigua TaxID=749465 RepID=A0ACC2IR33_9PLEO|nr:hypothetical protein OPT61_g1164 [Boeremia exigua]
MESSASASAGDVPSGDTSSLTNPRPKRSRTGCVTCRSRRRKCDEGKPNCQNCISKGFECRYAAAFQILGKHNFTPEVKVGVKYANVRFAVDGSEGPRSESARQPATAAEKEQNDYQIQTRPTIRPARHASKDLTSTNNASGVGHAPSPDSYEFALHGLLALGSTSDTTPGTDLRQMSTVGAEQAVSTFDFARDIHADSARILTNRQRRPRVHRTDTERSSLMGFDMTSQGTPGPSPSLSSFEASANSNHFYDTGSSTFIPDDEYSGRAVPANSSIELLKLYRYKIAPFLDICDTEQHFGVALLTESNRAPALRACIMQLAAASLSEPWVMEGHIVEQSTPNKANNESVTSDAGDGLITEVLNFLATMIPNLAASWLRKDGVQGRRYLLERLLLELGSSSLKSCAYWLLVRLELSRALMVGDNRISLPLTTGQPGEAGTNDAIAQYAYNAISLCVDSAMFAQGDDDRWLQERYGLNRVEVWRILIQGFAHWYMHRSQAFQPVIELYPKDGVLTDNDYPTIVFTSGTALLANQLYHTGMLLLLQNRPRFADRPSQNSPSMSTLWHAHRICGIAIQNDMPSWWDPCLVASLIVAGRTATHASQHSAIVHTLRFVQQLTGWTITPYVEQLRTEWQLADSWQGNQDYPNNSDV